MKSKRSALPSCLNRAVCALISLTPLSCRSAELQEQPAPPHKQRAESPHEARAEQDRAMMSLEDIPPSASLPQEATITDDTTPLAQQKIQKAHALMSEFRYTEAAQQLENALRFAPNSLRAHAMIGEASLELGNHMRAEQHLRKAIQIAPAQARLHYFLGLAYKQDGKCDPAMQEFRLATLCPDAEQDPGLLPLVHFHLAACLESEGYLTAAAQAYERYFAALNGNHADLRNEPGLMSRVSDLRLSAYDQLSDVYHQLNRLSDSARTLERASAFDPQNAEVLKKLTERHQEAGNFTQAADAAKKLVLIDDQYLQLLQSIRNKQDQGRMWLQQDLQELVELHPDRFEIVHALAQWHVDHQQVDKAVSQYRQYHAAYPKHAQCAAELGNLLAIQQNWDEAFMVLAALVTNTAKNQAPIEAWLALLEERELSAHLYERSIRLMEDPSSTAEQMYLFGRLAMQAGHPNDAIKAQVLALSHKPHFLPSMIVAAQAHLQQYQWKEALLYANGLIEKNPDQPAGYWLAGQAHLGLDQYEETVEAMNHVLRLHPHDIQAMQALARTYELDDKPLMANRQYQIILEEEPDNAHALEAIFQIAIAQQNTEQISYTLQKLSESEEARDRFLRCQAQLQALRTGNWEHYADKLRSIIQTSPNNTEVRWHLAGYHIMQRDYAAMKQLLEEILEINAQHDRARYLLSIVELRLLDFDRSLELLRQLLEKHPYRAEWNHTYASALIDQQEFAAASEHLLNMLQNCRLDDRTRNSVQYDLFMCAALGGDSPNIVQHAMQWIENQPDNLMLRAHLVALLHLQGESARAISLAREWLQNSDFESRKGAQAVLLQAYSYADKFHLAEGLLLDQMELDPHDFATTRALINVLAESERLSEAVELARACRLLPEYSNQYDQILVTLYSQDQQFDEAIRLIRQRLSATTLRDPMQLGFAAGTTHEDWRRLLCSALISAKRYDEAEQTLIAWQNENPPTTTLVGILRLMSLCYQFNDQFSLAIQQLEKLHSLDPTDAGICNDLAYNYALQTMQLEKAKQLALLAVGEEPRSAAFLDSLGWVQYKKGDFESAMQWLLKAKVMPSTPWSQWLTSSEHSLGQDDPVINDHLGDTAWRLGQSEQAVDYWETAIQRARQLLEETPLPEYEKIIDRNPSKIEAAARNEEPPIATSAIEATPAEIAH